MNKLKEKLKIIADVIGHKPVVFIDYPIYLNVGDLLIYHGTERFFSDYNINVAARINCLNFNMRQLQKIVTTETTLVFQGGGNFGDLYDDHQFVRLTVAKAFPNNRIILLPQTLYYKCNKTLSKDLQVFRACRDFHMFVRDTRSLDIAKGFTENNYLSPDMAHQLYGVLAKNKNYNHIQELNFIRKDIEASTYNGSSSVEKCMDWVDFVTLRDKQISKLVRIASRMNANCINSKFFSVVIAKFWKWYTWTMVNRASKYFSSYKKIITSRLHGHILSCLVDTDNVVIDNIYGKNSSYFDCWTNALKIAKKDIHNNG